MDYKNGKIYAIRSHQTEQIYIGSTTQTLTKRFSEHNNAKKNDCKSKQILQYDDAYIELIEFFPCNSKEELNKKEGEHIRTNNCVNKNIAGRTPGEYRQDNKEQIKHKMKEYKERNKEKIKEYNEEKKEEMREKRRQHYEKNKEKIKQYYEENKERISEQKKFAYEKKKLSKE